MIEFDKVLMGRDNSTADQAGPEFILARDALSKYLEVGDLNGAYKVCTDWRSRPDYLMGLI